MFAMYDLREYRNVGMGPGNGVIAKSRFLEFFKYLFMDSCTSGT